MLVIKLSQKGKTNKRMFRLIISEKIRDPFGNALETLGSYNPHSKELVARTERINYWLSKGAQMTPTVNNLLVDHKIIEKEKVVASKKGKKSEKKKAQVAAKDEKKKKQVEEKVEIKEDIKTEEPKTEESKEELKEETKLEEPKAEVKEEKAEEKKEEKAETEIDK